MTLQWISSTQPRWVVEEDRTIMVEVDPQVGDLEEITIIGVGITPIIIVQIGTIIIGTVLRIRAIQN